MALKTFGDVLLRKHLGYFAHCRFSTSKTSTLQKMCIEHKICFIFKDSSIQRYKSHRLLMSKSGKRLLSNVASYPKSLETSQKKRKNSVLLSIIFPPSFLCDKWRFVPDINTYTLMSPPKLSDFADRY
jgi:hypothetical protein